MLKSNTRICFNVMYYNDMSTIPKSPHFEGKHLFRLFSYKKIIIPTSFERDIGKMLQCYVWGFFNIFKPQTAGTKNHFAN